MKYIKNKHGRVIVVDSTRAGRLLKEPGYSIASEAEARDWQARHLKNAAPTEAEERASFLDEIAEGLEGMTKAEIIEFAASTYDLALDQSLIKSVMIELVVAFVRQSEGG